MHACMRMQFRAPSLIWGSTLRAIKRISSNYSCDREYKKYAGSSIFSTLLVHIRPEHVRRFDVWHQLVSFGCILKIRLAANRTIQGTTVSILQLILLVIVSSSCTNTRVSDPIIVFRRCRRGYYCIGYTVLVNWKASIAPYTHHGFIEVCSIIRPACRHYINLFCIYRRSSLSCCWHNEQQQQLPLYGMGTGSNLEQFVGRKHPNR